MLPTSTTDLRPRLEAVLSGRSSEADVTALARIALQLALTRLRQLLGSGRLHLESFQIPLNGLAFDCIAELFERDADSRFVELHAYFAGEREPAGLHDAELVHHFRLLVFTSVSDGIFRLYREHDPVLARIIRVVKLGLRRSPQLVSYRRFGETMICLAGKEAHPEDLPVMPLEQVEHWTALHHRPGATAPEVLRALGELLRGGGTSSSVRLIDLAVALKRLSSRGAVPASQVITMDDDMLKQDVSAIVSSATAAALEQLRQTYVRTSKMPVEVFDGYGRAIAEILQDTYVHNNGSDVSQSEYLRRHVPGLTHEDYRSDHRALFEYMVRKAKRAVQAELRELL